MTPPHKRKRLGPDLASRLTGRAWSIIPALDHEKLAKKNGTKYLLKFLQQRLCRTAVPDAGARLEDLLIRLKRPLGMPMSQWSNEVMEAYRRVQRALIRARQQQKPKEMDVKTVKTVSEPQGEPPSRAMSPLRPTSLSRPTSPTSPTRSTAAEGGLPPVQEADDDRGLYQPVPGDEPADEEPAREWTDEEWRQWKKQQQKEWYGDDSSSGEDHPWDELEVEDIQVLPDEVLGWLLLRRANLSSSSRLAVQSSVNNSLKFQDLEIST